MPLACNNGSAVTPTTIADRPDDVRALLRAVHQAVQFMQADRAESVRILAEWQQMDPRQAGLAFDAAAVHVSYSIDRAAGQQALENALSFAKESGQVEPGVQLADVAALSFYP